MEQYTIRGQTLTGQADQLRNLMGSTGTMTPEEMTAQILRANQNVDEALLILGEKGAAVSDSARLPQLPALIAGIATGTEEGLSRCTVRIHCACELGGGYCISNDGITVEPQELSVDPMMEEMDNIRCYVLENVVCGSAITVVGFDWFYGAYTPNYEINGNAEEYTLPMEGVLIFQAPLYDGDECDIDFTVG